ncbi:MAG: UDP-N-acetylmuramoyl-tripeptide-D-alanyl-D-alanine ligase [Candidatus Woesebacteria bacterium GW2011_GWB1_38_5b]|uniref:UDP-N-acetylmuramoyl-tripeptide--D-alanyl-D-alanine ligase n=1 Tax=Candidatus Woesebacteria bacterium GW2011_GWB1_38_5b TaxID=1618569 RepID=A0A0G0K7J9_9BACT|nr:MAG: UDP-N-acetylmuramoyl-tripeptide-D-alanyl-D-alanine ligase [Candidatus Woesebacteria bacterium GW2011_GWB1_38_5b]
MHFFKKYIYHPVKNLVAKYYLHLLQKLFGLKVIAITGSAGKTTTKEMISSILKLQGKVISSFANIDPVYNIPTTILKCRPDTKFLVLEMGVEFPGELDFYLWLAHPNIAVITNVYPTHLLFFKSVEGVYKEKSKIIRRLDSDGFAILPAESEFYRKLVSLNKAKDISFGKNGFVNSQNLKINKDFKSEFILYIGKENIKVTLSVIGEQFVHNALSAAAAAHALGISIINVKKGLESFSPAEHRMKVIKHKSGAIIIDDAYNNNPEAAKEAIKVFSQIAKSNKKIIVFGDMLELGPDEDKYHQEIAKLISKLSIDKFIGVGKATQKMKITKEWFERPEDVYKSLRPMLKKNTYVLVKGSRSIGLEKLIERLYN